MLGDSSHVPILVWYGKNRRYIVCTVQSRNYVVQGLGNKRIHRRRVNYSVIEGGGYENNEMRPLTSVKMEEILSMTGPFLYLETNRSRPLCEKQLAANSTAMARYRRSSFSGQHVWCLRTSYADILERKTGGQSPMPRKRLQNRVNWLTLVRIWLYHRFPKTYWLNEQFAVHTYLHVKFLTHPRPLSPVWQHLCALS
jgi:hypothetical protein